MSFKMRVYGFLVNRKSGINYRYHKFHDGANGFARLFSWVYLLWLNLAYYVFFCRFLGEKPDCEFYEHKKIPCDMSESSENKKKYPELNVSEFVDRLKEYDIVSFDVFDTLILRPLSQPTDLFFFVGEELGVMDFKGIRIWAEADARCKVHSLSNHYEVSLSQIWDNMRQELGEAAEGGNLIEEKTEKSLCYANPFMAEVWKELKKLDKRIIITSDMYLPSDTIKEILEKNGFSGAEKIYISNEYGKNKYEGRIYETVKNDFQGKRIVHVGDNPRSDFESAKRAGIDVKPYPQINRNMLLLRPYDMSYLVGSAYRGIVSNYLYNGLNEYSMEYEYGFVYGGLFVLGYCNFIHDYYVRNSLDKLLFLSRDGDILLQVYKELFPKDNAEYVYWSRKAATKLMAAYDRHDYFRRFVYHKINQNYTIHQVLETMELEFLEGEFGDWKNIFDEWNERHYKGSELEKYRNSFIELNPSDRLTQKNAYLLRRFIEAKWDKVINAYSAQSDSAKKYWEEHLNGVSKTAAVDIGWAGSGAIALMYLVEKVWKMPCELNGIVAGTNTVHNSEPEASEHFLQSGRLTAYLFSQSHNRDLMKKHDPGKDYNVFWELLLSSPEPRFEGFYPEGPKFGKTDYNTEGIKEIQKGIRDFVTEYTTRFKDYPYMFDISGRDAYAPILVAGGKHEKYLKTIEQKFKLNVNVE